uniref:acetyl-CoA carboxylase beta subunit n=1 Tax=Hydnora abyssinica TaxID=470280 RepID=UPI002115C4EF|nr:acetyl-CoA carboxylase beta subunit [Hydnora abyssinica]USN93587.1 acetyl-CoA carboxylase beta subunit [Hydnora abyssinica]
MNLVQFIDLYVIFETYKNFIFFNFINEINPYNIIDPLIKFKHLWILCDKCKTLNYKKFCKEHFFICETCGIHLKMNSYDRINLLLDKNTWKSFEKDLFVVDPIDFDLNYNNNEELDLVLQELSLNTELNFIKENLKKIGFDKEILTKLKYENNLIFRNIKTNYDIDFEFDRFNNYIDTLIYYSKLTTLTEAVQIGIGKLNEVLIAIGFMDFNFIGGSMGLVVGEKLTRLIEYATKKSLPLIIICASGGARMQEGSLSLMQMAKISSALYQYQSKKDSLYISILTSPTTGGVTASFGMLGDIIITEPDAYLAFAGKRVIEKTLNIKVPEGFQKSEYLFKKGLCDLLLPRPLLKIILSELFLFHRIK